MMDERKRLKADVAMPTPSMIWQLVEQLMRNPEIARLANERYDMVAVRRILTGLKS